MHQNVSDANLYQSMDTTWAVALLMDGCLENRDIETLRREVARNRLPTPQELVIGGQDKRSNGAQDIVRQEQTDLTRAGAPEQVFSFFKIIGNRRVL